MANIETMGKENKAEEDMELPIFCTECGKGIIKFIKKGNTEFGYMDDCFCCEVCGTVWMKPPK